MPDQEREVLIEKYFLQRLSAEEEENLQNLLQGDKELREAVEAQQVLLEGLEISAIKDKLAERFEEFHALKDSSPVQVWRNKKFLSITAGLFVVLASTTFAGYRFGWFDKWRENEKAVEQHGAVSEVRVEPPVEIKDISGLNMIVQEATVHSGYEMEVNSTPGTTFLFSPGSFNQISGGMIFDSVSIEIMEVQGQDELAALTAGTVLNGKEIIRAFYIMPHFSGGSIEINVFNPPRLLFTAVNYREYNVWYGGDDRMSVNWQPTIDRSAPLIEEPSSQMEDYRRFMVGMQLLDSINTYYLQDGDLYKHKEGKDMVFKATFVSELKNFITDYRNNPLFIQNVFEARHSWQVYQQQHSPPAYQIDYEDQRAILLYDPGWYILTGKINKSYEHEAPSNREWAIQTKKSSGSPEDFP